jgi:hypothetical protein
MRVKSQSLKIRGKITITVWNRDRNTKFPNLKPCSLHKSKRYRNNDEKSYEEMSN